MRVSLWQQRNGISFMNDMTLEEERDYWKELVEDLTDSMDKTALRYFRLLNRAEELYKNLDLYQTENPFANDSIAYKEAQVALLKFEIYQKEN